MEIIDKTFKIEGLESTLINGVASRTTRCYRVYANLVAMPIKGFACIFTDVSGEYVVDMCVNSCLQINAVNTTTFEHKPLFETPQIMNTFTMLNHMMLDITDQDECVWIHEFRETIKCPLEFVFHLEIPDYWVLRHQDLRFRMKLIG